MLHTINAFQQLLIHFDNFLKSIHIQKAVINVHRIINACIKKIAFYVHHLFLKSDRSKQKLGPGC